MPFQDRRGLSGVSRIHRKHSRECGHPADIETEHSPISSPAMVLAARDIGKKAGTADLRYDLTRSAEFVSADTACIRMGR